MNILDLFSGIGGFSLGLERTGGFRTVAFCEINPFCRRVLAKHWPQVPCYNDIQSLTAKQLKKDKITVDLICGGFPCQDISLAGKGAGIEGRQSRLWSEFARLIGEIRPRYVIVENVPVLRIRGLDRVLGDLATLRYDAEWHCIPAYYVGADHQRDRIWIIAYPSERNSPRLGWELCAEKVGKNVTDHNSARSSRWLPARTFREDKFAFDPWLRLALDSAPTFPGKYRAYPPVLGRGEDGIPNRVDRMFAIGNAVVPQVVEIIGKAILQVEKVVNNAPD